MSENIVSFLYLIASILFIFSLRGLSHPETSRKGNIFGILGMGIAINPELYGAPAIKFGTEETSEFHRANIDQYPEIKKFMENWVKISAKRHKIFEKNVKAKNIHKLDLSKYGEAEAIEETKTTVSSSGTTEELKECVKLFKANELTKEQFENCKNKVLSQ